MSGALSQSVSLGLCPAIVTGLVVGSAAVWLLPCAACPTIVIV